MEQLWAFVLAAYIGASVLVWYFVVYRLFNADDVQTWERMNLVRKAMSIVTFVVGWVPLCIWIAVKEKQK